MFNPIEADVVEIEVIEIEVDAEVDASDSSFEAAAQEILSGGYLEDFSDFRF